MTFQFIVKYIDTNEAVLPFDYEYTIEYYADLFAGKFIHAKRIRAHSYEQAVQKFTQMYPDYDIISMR